MRDLRIAALALTLAAWLTLAPLAVASGESSNESSAGGLAFAANPAIRLVQHDLVIAADRISITYAVRNDTETQQALLVAFALPDLDAGPLTDGEVALASNEAANFVKSTTLVDGQPVTLHTEQRAHALGLDVTAVLVASGLDPFPLAKDAAAKLAALSDAQRLELLERGILRDDGGTMTPAWTLKTVAYWRQTFAANRTTTIQHSYRPIPGVTPWRAEALPALRKRACLSGIQESALGRLPSSSLGGPTLTSVSFHATANGEALGPAQRFRLIVETSDPSTIVATCREGLKQTGPMQQEWSATDYVLEDDMLFVFAR